MRAGTLRHRVTIQEEAPISRDTFGAEVPTWSNVATVWAAVEPLNGQERFVDESDQRVATATTRIRIRYRSGLTVKMRVVWGSQTFNILEIRHIETRQREIHLLCEEINPG